MVSGVLEQLKARAIAHVWRDKNTHAHVYQRIDSTHVHVLWGNLLEHVHVISFLILTEQTTWALQWLPK